MLDSRLGVLFAAGLAGPLAPGPLAPGPLVPASALPLGAFPLVAGDPPLENDRLGELPAKVDSEGFLDHGSMLLPGIFHPLLQPICVVQITQAINENLVQCAILVRITNQSFDSIDLEHGCRSAMRVHSVV